MSKRDAQPDSGIYLRRNSTADSFIQVAYACHLLPDFPYIQYLSSEEDKFLGCSHQERWERLKLVIVALYLGKYGGNGKRTKIADIVSHMRNHYSFHAANTHLSRGSQSEYPHKFRAWGVSDRRVTKAQLDELALALQRKSKAGMSTSLVGIKRNGQEEPLDLRKAKRHLKGKHSAMEPETVQPGWLSSWVLPYSAFASALPKTHDEPSPYGQQPATPGYLAINSPEVTSQAQETNGPSPNLELFYQKAKDNRASLFLQGRLQELMVSMNQQDRKICVDYFHELYLHGYTTAKNWGSTPSIIPIVSPSMTTPVGWNSNSPWTLYLNSPPGPTIQEGSQGFSIVNAPTQLCRWAIHVPDISYTPAPDDDIDAAIPAAAFQDSIHDSIVSGNFATVQADSLPFSHEKIIQCLSDNPAALKMDSFKLAIMSGNHELLYSLLGSESREIRNELRSQFPFHLAASFISGGGSCCSILGELLYLGAPALPKYNIDDLGHTILDNLMVSIMRSHTRIHPDIVSYGFNSLSRFPGEEKDICGRWDADSPEIRQLFAQGYARIPSRWKHPFCHSSVQAICHAIITLFGSKYSPNVDTLSGLFTRRCTECGLELKLGPLHVLVVTAFYLAQSGMAGETLFGPLAILVCLISVGADISLRVNISVDDLLQVSETGTCRHRSMTASELAAEVPHSLILNWSPDCQVGWACLLQTLSKAQEVDCQVGWACPLQTLSKAQEVDEQDEYTSNDSERGWDEESGSEECNESSHCELEGERIGSHDLTNIKCTGPTIGLLWATIQTELLTYRKLEENDPWISANFSMRALQEWLENRTDNFEIPLVQQQMMNPHSDCGWFGDSDVCFWAVAEDACKERFMNMDDYRRSSFSQVPDIENW
ncbi:hypothetical protein FBEOM_4381 [Fusarium beomiforme]|uniref:Clr5 domain-containing protein n=1 Tax=Fusarium beomiforme TaxID=44412 RepID=A0A9P5ANB2_9HYPO|nr:hypothetical protein FBEOM_4381 [Fusarium beomiforme]